MLIVALNSIMKYLLVKPFFYGTKIRYIFDVLVYSRVGVLNNAQNYFILPIIKAHAKNDSAINDIIL